MGKRATIVLLNGVMALVIAGFMLSLTLINSEIVKQFGQPSDDLSLIQRVVYPLELFLHRERMLTPAESVGAERPFSVAPGESVSMISIRLEQEGLIEDAELFRIYLVYSGLDRQLQSGEYVLSPTMSPLEIAKDLLDATPKDATVTILPGWRIEEVAANVASSGLAVDAEAFTLAAYQPTADQLALLPGVSVPALEGYLYPGSYVFPRETALQEIFPPILMAFSANVTPALLEGFERQGLSVEEAVILASIVEKEAILDPEKPLIASVFHNRLAAGMKLETDPTVQYALGWQADTGVWWKSPLSLEDLATDSAYNTYLNGGLPPTPICSPDAASLSAVAFPAEAPYYYFRAACDGSGRHNFAITYEEHLDNACD